MRLLVELFLYGAIADPSPIVTVVKELASVDGNLLLAGASGGGGGGGFRNERERERAERERESALASLTLLVAFARCGRPLLGLKVDAAEEEVRRRMWFGRASGHKEGHQVIARNTIADSEDTQVQGMDESSVS